MKPTVLLVSFALVALVGVPPIRGEVATSSGAPVTSRWTHGAAMPTARLAAGAAAVDGKLYVVGGAVIRDHAVVALDVVEAYDPAADTWQTRAPLPTARSSFGVAVAAGRIYVVGGTPTDTTGSLDVVEAYDPRTDCWERVAPLPTPRSQVGAATLQGRIYAVGGNAGHEFDFAIYDPTANRWTAQAPLATPHRNAAVLSARGKLFVFGGVTTDGSTLVGALDEYDPSTGRWATGESLPTARTDFAAAELAGKLVALGGFNRGPLRAVDEFDPATGHWTRRADLPAPRQFSTAATLDGKIHLAGGTSALPDATASLLVQTLPSLADAARPAAAVPAAWWRLPTGSRIAYVHVAAAHPNGAPPLVFIHGGPGACETYAYAFARPWYERLAAQGFDVYLYDQIGGGLSARLSDPRDYTLDRHVADLEAIRRQIGRERLTLLGESHGATFSAHCLAAHPDCVERVVFFAPGALDPAAWKASVFPYATPRLAPAFLASIAPALRATRVDPIESLRTEEPPSLPHP